MKFTTSSPRWPVEGLLRLRAMNHSLAPIAVRAPEIYSNGFLSRTRQKSIWLVTRNSDHKRDPFCRAFCGKPGQYVTAPSRVN